MRVVVCDNCKQDACAVREQLPGQGIRFYGSAESLFTDVGQDGRHFNLFIHYADGRVQERYRKLLFEEVG